MWQSFLSRWVHQQARAKLYEQATTAAGQRTGGDGEPGDDGPPPDADVAIMFALGIESGGVQDLLAHTLVTQGQGFTVRQGRFKGRLVVLVESGIGAAAAARGTEVVLAGHRPRWVISAGFSGGLVPTLEANDIVMADSLVDSSGRQLSIDLKVSTESLAATKGVHVGRLLTVDHIIHDPAQKRALGEQHAALAADMESFAVGEVCRRQKTRFLAVRVISDTVDEMLPRDVMKLSKPTSLAGKLGAVTGTLWRRPSSVKDMLRLHQRAVVSADRLAQFLGGVVEQLVPAAEPAPPAESSP